MKASGSILIVVLGLLAILAVIGITFVTMSNLDRRTATNFAVQSQFMLAADGAVDYVCHHLVQDVWLYDTRTYQYRNTLLTDDPNQVPSTIPLTKPEPFDYPSDDYDPWLATIPTSTNLTGPVHYSYQDHATKNEYYGIGTWGTRDQTTKACPNNIGYPDSSGQVLWYTETSRKHGVWIPELSFPFETGLIRVSVTVLDHAGMLNFNAHGNEAASGEIESPGYGFFVSDVRPNPNPGEYVNVSTLNGKLWATGTEPGNPTQLAAVIENPGRYDDHPFTLDEEFELRCPFGTRFRSRIENLSGSLNASPETTGTTTAVVDRRLNVTTIGWVSQVRTNYNRRAGRSFEPVGGTTEGYGLRKIDLNIDEDEDIHQALVGGNVFDWQEETDRRLAAQFAANICAFRDGDPDGGQGGELDHYRVYSFRDPQAPARLGATRQPVIREAKAEIADTRQEEEDAKKYELWKITVTLVSPWSGAHEGDTGGGGGATGVPAGEEDVKLELSDKGSFDATFDEKDFDELDDRIGRTEKDYECRVEIEEGDRLKDAIGDIRLVVEAGGQTWILDEIPEEAVDQLQDNKQVFRGVDWAPKEIAPGKTSVTVAYFWQPSKTEWFTSSPGNRPQDAIPVMFPKSVSYQTRENPPQGGLPPYRVQTGGRGTTSSFRAFARVGDLNRVLLPSRSDAQAAGNAGGASDFFWPWVPEVATKRAQAGQEDTVKFNWLENVAGVSGGGGSRGGAGGGTTGASPQNFYDLSRMNAANVFCVGGPWNDRIDNDGDGYCDADGGDGTFRGPDEGLLPGNAGGSTGGGTGGLPSVNAGGRFGGPELRVAGMVNLNTATPATLEALENSFGLTGLKQTVLTLRSNGPIFTPAQILDSGNVSCTGTEALGWLETRDLAYTRISNVATVRSDTFSVYGTVQYGHTEESTGGFEFKPVRARRFWALIDRSPSLAYYPGLDGGSEQFIRPRVVNFQWLD